MNLDQELKNALRREAPPAGFAARVMHRIELEEARRPTRWRATAASLLLALSIGGFAAHRVAEHRRGERAKEQVIEAMRIAGEKVRYAQQEVRGIGSQN